MTLKHVVNGRIAFSVMALLAFSASAQDPAATAQEQTATDPVATEPSDAGPQWRAFSRSATTIFLIDVSGSVRDGDQVSVQVARVGTNKPAGDYSHVVDDFAVRCDAQESHMVASTEAYEDGVLTETFPADEPWSSIQRGSFDEGIKQIACGESIPTGQAFPTVAAYIDAGRP